MAETKQQVAASKPQVQTGGGVAPLRPTDIDGMWRFCQFLSTSPSLPDTYRYGSSGKRDPYTPEQVQGNILVAVQTGAEIGLPPMQAILSIAMINGRPFLWGDGLIAAVRGSGICAFIKEKVTGEGDKMVAECHAKRSDTGEEGKATFSWKQAVDAGYAGRNPIYRSRPDRMLKMRARSECLRDLFADFLKGIGGQAETAIEDRVTLQMGADGVYEPAPARPTRESTRARSAEPTTYAVIDEGGVVIADGLDAPHFIARVIEAMHEPGVDYESIASNNFDTADMIDDAVEAIQNALDGLRASAEGDASTSESAGGSGEAADQSRTAEPDTKGRNDPPGQGEDASAPPVQSGASSPTSAEKPPPATMPLKLLDGTVIPFEARKVGVNALLRRLGEEVEKHPSVYDLNEALMLRICDKAPDFAGAIEAIAKRALQLKEAAPKAAPQDDDDLLPLG